MAEIPKNTPAFGPSDLPKSGREAYEQFDISYRGKAGESREALRISTVATEADPIYFWINPSETQWRIATRTSIEQIQGGAVHHEWRSVGVGLQPSQKFDQPVINFTFQSGLILPNGHDDSNADLNALPQGLGNLYDFMELLNADTVTGSGSPNYVIIDYVSLIFPNIRLKGFFTSEGVQWTDSAENPHMVQGWGASFVVFESNPNLADAAQLKINWLNRIY